MTSYIAAVDQGTTSTRCIIFNHAGEVQCSAQKELVQIYPKPGWVEHDPMEIWACTQEVIQAAVGKLSQLYGASAQDIAAVGVTNQRETAMVWDRHSGKPVYNAIVWQDTRTKDICDRLEAEGMESEFRRVTGLPFSTYFSGPKIQWIFEQVPGVKEAAQRGNLLAGTIDSWIIWWLTGGPGGGSHITDVTNASRTLLMDLDRLDWNNNNLEIMGIPRHILPRIVPSSDPESWGKTLADGPFQAAIPVCGNLGDQQAALVGQACFTPGEAKNTYGTGCFMLMNTGEEPIPSESGLLTTLAYKIGSRPAVYALEGSIAIAGALIQWLRDNLGIIQSSAEVEALAQTVENNGGIYFIPAFSGLFAPYWRSDARGVIVGMTRYINKGHIARAALEATAYQTREVLEAMYNDSGVNLTTLKVDGGMVHNNLLMQFQSDILGVQVVRPKVAETTALGAAYAAGLAVGFWENLDDLRQNWLVDRTWQPVMSPETRQNLYREWLKGVKRTFDWID